MENNSKLNIKHSTLPKSKKILVTGTAGFIGFHLAKKLLKQGHEVVGLDNINDYYDINLKYARLKELGIGNGTANLFGANPGTGNLLPAIQSTKFPNHKFYKANLEDTETINHIFKTEKFDAVCNLAAQAGEDTQ